MDLALVPEPCDLAVIDVSFISLTLVLPRVAELLRPPAGKPIVALVKPQFEVGRDQVGKGGVVRDEAARRGAVDKIRTLGRASTASSPARTSSRRSPARPATSSICCCYERRSYDDAGGPYDSATQRDRFVADQPTL